MEKMAAAFSDTPDIIIPKPEKHLCSKNIIVMEKISGIKLTDEASLTTLGIDVAELLKRVLKSFLKKLLKMEFITAIYIWVILG